MPMCPQEGTRRSLPPRGTRCCCWVEMVCLDCSSVAGSPSPTLSRSNCAAAPCSSRGCPAPPSALDCCRTAAWPCSLAVIIGGKLVVAADCLQSLPSVPVPNPPAAEAHPCSCPLPPMPCRKFDASPLETPESSRPADEALSCPNTRSPSVVPCVSGLPNSRTLSILCLAAAAAVNSVEDPAPLVAATGDCSAPVVVAAVGVDSSALRCSVCTVHVIVGAIWPSVSG